MRLTITQLLPWLLSQFKTDKKLAPAGEKTPAAGAAEDASEGIAPAAPQSKPAEDDSQA